MTEQSFETEWTILVYIAAHNDLDPYGLTSLKQILAAGSTARVKLAVFFDGYNDSERFIVGEPGERLQGKKLGKIDSGDPDRLVATAKWAFDLCPAKRYGLVLWSHGTGFWNEDDHIGRWTPDQMDALAQVARGKAAVVESSSERAVADASMALFRTTLLDILRHPDPNERAILFDCDKESSLDTLQLERVCQEIKGLIRQPIDLLGLDACLLGCVEVAYQLRECVHCLIASEELTPATSWPYHRIFPKLHADPTLSARALSAQIVEEIIAYYEPRMY